MLNDDEKVLLHLNFSTNQRPRESPLNFLFIRTIFVIQRATVVENELFESVIKIYACIQREYA